MFLYCESSCPSSGGGGGTQTVNNYNYYNTGLKNLFAFDHFSITGSPVYSGSIATMDYAIGGTFNIIFNEEVVFDGATLNANTGPNTVILKTLAGVNIETLTFSTTTVTKKILIGQLTFQLTDNLIALQFLTSASYTRRIFNEPAGTEIINLYNPKISGAVATGTGLNGPVEFEFLGAIIYGAKFTGVVSLYNGSNLVYRNTVLYYPNPITRAVFDTISEIYYFVPQNPEYNTTLYTINCEYETYEFDALGNIDPSGFTGAITFKEPTFIDELNFSASAAIILDGKNYNVTGNVNKTMRAQLINVQNLVSIKYEKKIHAEQFIGNFAVRDFTNYSPGTINFYKEPTIASIVSTNQLANPAMFNGTGIIVSQDNNSLAPTGGPGIITVTFSCAVYLRDITVNGTGSVFINGKTYIICNNKVFFHDWINSNCILTTGFVLNYNGVLVDMNYSAASHKPFRNLITEDFSTQTVEFSVTLFDTNIFGALGTPNNAFFGPGFGPGGGPGFGANANYLGLATQDDITFINPTFVESITFLNCESGYKVDLLDINLVALKSLFIGNFDTNSVHTVYVNTPNVKKIVRTGNYAIVNIVYESFTREVIGLIDNSPTPVAITSELSGNFTLRIMGETSSLIHLSKATPTALPSIFIQSSPSAFGEQVFAQWNSGETIKIYHSVLRTGGIGNVLWYTCIIT